MESSNLNDIIEINDIPQGEGLNRKRKVGTSSPPSSPQDTETSIAHATPTKKFKAQELPDWWNDLIESEKTFLSTLRGSDDLKQSLEHFTQNTTPIIGNTRNTTSSANTLNTTSSANTLNTTSSANTLNTTHQTVLLPLPPVGGLTSRFINNKKDGKIPCIQRDSFKPLKEFIERKKGLTYVYGPHGVGKSFALYHLYCTLSISDKNRVMYIPDCANLNSGAYARLYNAILAAFALDSNFLQQVAHYAIKMDQNDWVYFLFEIINYCKREGLTFYAIFDQYSDLDLSLRRSAPTNFTKWANNLPGAKIIISVSSDNQDKPIKIEDDQSFYWFSGGYSDTELAAWRKYHSFFEGEDFSDVTRITGKIPFELDKLRRLKLQTPTLTLNNLLEEYIRQRISEMNRSHKAYLAKLPELKKSIEKRCMLAAINGLAVPLAPEPVFDRQLFFFQSPFIIPVVPLALDVVRPLLSGIDLDAFITDCVTHPYMTTDFKERAVQHYIIQRVLGAAQLTVKQFHITRLGHLAERNRLKVCHINIRNLRLVEFSGLLTPPSLPNQNTLFVPTTPNYPDVDFIIWDHEVKKLWVFQVTLMHNPFEHSNNKWVTGFSLHDAWKQFLTVDGDVPDMAKVWIIRCASTTVNVPESFEGQWMFDLKDPDRDLSMFPVLKQLP